MNNERRKDEKDIGRIFREGTEIDAALKAAAAEAVRRHRQAGLPLVVWKDGKSVLVPADEIDMPEEDGDDGGGSAKP